MLRWSLVMLLLTVSPSYVFNKSGLTLLDSQSGVMEPGCTTPWPTGYGENLIMSSASAKTIDTIIPSVNGPKSDAHHIVDAILTDILMLDC
jgi:hypothetical protein